MENKEKNSVSELMETTMTKIREMVDSNSVIALRTVPRDTEKAAAMSSSDSIESP